MEVTHPTDSSITACMEDHYCHIDDCAACDGTYQYLQDELVNPDVEVDEE